MFMKKIILPMFALLSYASMAQLSILPQVGMEASRTTIKSTDFSSFAPAGMQFAPRLSLRMMYKFKTGQSVFAGVATSAAPVEFSFSDPFAAKNSFTQSSKDLQLRFEGGYQFSTKPITLRKPVFATVFTNRFAQRYGGGQRGYGRCGMRNAAGGNISYKTVEKVKGLYMRIKPSIGLALAPSAGKIETETENGQTTYEYKAGFNTAVIAGAALEFGTRNHTDLVVSLNYVKGIGNNEQTLTTGTDVKPVKTTFSSKTSGFNLSIGIPISLNKTKSSSQHTQCTRSSYHGQCGRFRS